MKKHVRKICIKREAIGGTPDIVRAKNELHGKAYAEDPNIAVFVGDETMYVHFGEPPKSAAYFEGTERTYAALIALF